MAKKHTPGPWEASYGTEGYYYLTHKDGLELRENTEENSLVLAAAPEMLAKLVKIAAWLESQALSHEVQAQTSRFVTIQEACAADAKNFRATLKDIRKVIGKATST